MTPLTRRATAEYRRATEAQVESGARWYPEAHEIARDQAEEYGTTIEITSGILAALSPRQGWAQNVKLAERMLASDGTLDHGCLGRSLEQARAIYLGIPPLDVLGGPKTRAFYAAILTAGESPDAVVDRHAWDMLVGQRGATPPTLKQYRTAADVMGRAAKILGETVHHVQATTWVVWRSRFWAAGVNDYRPEPLLEGTGRWA